MRLTLELQRAAGNAAIVRLLTGGDAAARRLARVSVTLKLDRDRTPPRRIGAVTVERGKDTAGGAHTTAFIVYAEAVRNAFIGRTLVDARDGLRSLLGSLPTLYDYEMLADGKESFDAKLGAARDELAGMDDQFPEEWLDRLQTAAHAYLELVHLMPGTIDPLHAVGTGKKAVGEDSERVGGGEMRRAYETLTDAPGEGGTQVARDPNNERAMFRFAEGLAKTFEWHAAPHYQTGGSAKVRKEELPILGRHLTVAVSAYPRLTAEQWGRIWHHFLNYCAKNQYLWGLGRNTFVTEFATMTGIKLEGGAGGFAVPAEVEPTEMMAVVGQPPEGEPLDEMLL